MVVIVCLSITLVATIVRFSMEVHELRAEIGILNGIFAKCKDDEEAQG